MTTGSNVKAEKKIKSYILDHISSIASFIFSTSHLLDEACSLYSENVGASMMLYIQAASASK